MQIGQGRSFGGSLLEPLLAVTRDILQAQDLATALASIASSVSTIFGFRYLSIVTADEPGGDLYRRVLLGFEQELLNERLGERIPREDIKIILLPEFEILRNCFYCPAEREFFWKQTIYIGDFEVPPEPRSAPDAWHDRDSLTFVLPDRDGEMLGYLSVDGPHDGLVPTLDTLRQMQLFVNLVGLALGNARAHRSEIERRELLEAGARIQSDFFGMVSHEVRSPLAAIRGATSLLESHFETMGEDRRQELLGVLGSATSRLTTIFEDFLLLSRMDANQVGLRPVSVSPIVTIEEAIAQLRSQHQDRAFNLAYLDPIPNVLADEGRLVQVLANLLSNAVRYSFPASPIHVEVKAGPDVVTIAVINEGAGIRPEDQDKLFTRFGRLSHHDGSTGLGLYICRELVTKMNGTIGFESDPGRLTSFWFTLPRSS